MGFHVHVGLKAIAKAIKVRSPQTVLEYAKKYADPNLNLKLVIRPLPNGKFTWITTSEFIHEWLKALHKARPEELKRVSRHRPKIVRRTCERCGEVVLGSRGYAAMRKVLSRD